MFLRSRQRLQGKRSVSLVETAIVLPMVFLGLMGMIDFAYIFYVKQTVTHAVREGGRVAITGRILTTNEVPNSWVKLNIPVAGGARTNILVADPYDTSRPMSREIAIFEMMKRNMMTITNVANSNSPMGWPHITIRNYSSTNSARNLGPGTRSDDNVTQYVEIGVGYPVKIMTPINGLVNFFGGGSGGVFGSNYYKVSYTCIFINEPWGLTNVSRYTN